jgi:hypothetical protein
MGPQHGRWTGDTGAIPDLCQQRATFSHWSARRSGVPARPPSRSNCHAALCSHGQHEPSFSPPDPRSTTHDSQHARIRLQRLPRDATCAPSLLLSRSDRPILTRYTRHLADGLHVQQPVPQCRAGCAGEPIPPRRVRTTRNAHDAGIPKQPDTRVWSSTRRCSCSTRHHPGDVGWQRKRKRTGIFPSCDERFANTPERESRESSQVGQLCKSTQR